MSNFQWMCRLAMIVEEILDQNPQGPPSCNPWDDCYRGSAAAGMGTEGIEAHLELWKQYLPATLRVKENDHLTPLPHCVINEMVSLSSTPKRGSKLMQTVFLFGQDSAIFQGPVA
jgi:hypothetical protein